MTLVQSIHGARHRLGLDDETARDFYERTVGKRRLTLMTGGEQQRVLDALNATAPARKVGLTGPYAKKLQALWIAGWNLGLVGDRTDGAMLAFVHRQTGIEHTRFLRDAADARKAVEGLKAWLARDGGVGWGSSCGRDFLAHDQGKIAWAQWSILDPAADLATYGGDCSFHGAVKDIVGTRWVTIGSLKPADWREVMNAFGKRVRAVKGLAA